MLIHAFKTLAAHKIRMLKILNVMSHHEMSLEVKHALSIIPGSNWGNVKHTEVKPNLPVCL